MSPLPAPRCGTMPNSDQIDELFNEQHADTERVAAGGAIVECLSHVVAIAIAQLARQQPERDPEETSGDGYQPAHFDRENAGRPSAVTPLRRACLTSASRRAVSASSTARPSVVRR